MLNAVCPNCSNMLIVKTTDGSDDFPEGRNAFACRTCPYRFIIEDMWYETRKVEAKRVDDIISEADMWKGATDMEGESSVQ